MDKTQILAALTASGEINTFRQTDNWTKAFELYNKAHGGHKSMSCGSCYRDVLNWLKA